MDFDTRLMNVILLGFGFMCVFTAFQTMGNIEMQKRFCIAFILVLNVFYLAATVSLRSHLRRAILTALFFRMFPQIPQIFFSLIQFRVLEGKYRETVLSMVRHETPEFSGDGYISLAIIYSVFALSNWVAPSVISLTSAKIAMILGAITYTLFILSFLIISTILLYVMSVVIGFGAAIIWTGQGNYLILNSDKSTIGRNSGIFWAMLQCSMFIGNIFVYFQFQSDNIDKSTRNVVFIVLGVVASVGIGFLCTLRSPKQANGTDAQVSDNGPVAALKNSFKLFATKEMLLLVVTFFYTGIELSFFSGVYSTSVGNTNKFKQYSKALVGLCGVFVGVGEVLGGLLFSITSSKMNKWGRDPIVISGFFIHVIAFFLIFINLPNMSPKEESNEDAFIESNQYLAMFCSFLLGLGDSCFNTQIYSMLGSIWSLDSAPAVAIFKFVQSVGAATSFYYGKHATLQVHLGILLGLSLIGTGTFCLVEWMHRVRERSKSEISTSSDSQSTIPSNISIKSR